MAKWRVALTAFTMLVAGLVPPAFAQTWTPNFDLILPETTVNVTHDQTFDYGFHPPDVSTATMTFVVNRHPVQVMKYNDAGTQSQYRRR